jgi:hypothetical protein
LDEVKKAKDSFRENIEEKDDKGPLITASPLEYHTFRQEISSKYPAYNPPASFFPMDPDQKSILPPLRVPTKVTSTVAIPPAQHGTSILHQPVHIATPAPSPPPSPQIGKGGKKQNYQTNNMFPFLYPPLDATSNRIGGKGSTDLQDVLVGRKWEGSDIPASILEAAELFSKRMRATRALKQLWGERVEFMKYERGWSDIEGDDIAYLDFNEKPEAPKAKQLLDGGIEDRLQAVENFYVCSLNIHVFVDNANVKTARRSATLAIYCHGSHENYSRKCHLFNYTGGRTGWHPKWFPFPGPTKWKYAATS